MIRCSPARACFATGKSSVTGEHRSGKGGGRTKDARASAAGPVPRIPDTGQACAPTSHASLCRLPRLSQVDSGNPNGYERRAGTWLVPSQTKGGDGPATYRVNLEAKTCTCLDHKEGGFTCKHYYAATIVHQRDLLPDGTIIETKSMTFTEKKTYKQNWPAYNAAQATEKRRVRVLLHDLCRRLPERERPANASGPKPHATGDSVFAMAFKSIAG